MAAPLTTTLFTNATLLHQYRSKIYPAPMITRLIGVIHIFLLLWVIGTLVLWYKHVQFKKQITGNYKGVTRGARLIIYLTFVVGCSELGYLSFFPSGFTRQGGVVGNDAYTSDQFGYMNSSSTLWCKVSSLLLFWSLSSMLMTTWLLMHHVYRLAVSTRGSTGGHNSLLHGDGCVSFISENPRYVIAFALPLLNIVLQGAMSTQGPIGSYCFVRCAEIGIDTIFTSPGRCWLRLVAIYWLCFIFGPLIIWDAARLVLHIRAVHKMGEKTGVDQKKLKEMRKSKKKSASAKMRDRLVWFSTIVSLAMFGAAIVRIRSSLTPDPLKEGTNGIAEYISIVITPFMILTFSQSLWMQCFGCSKEVEQNQAKFKRRNSFAGSSQAGKSSSGRNSDLGNDVTKTKGDLQKMTTIVSEGIVSGQERTSGEVSKSNDYVTTRPDENALNGDRDSNLGSSTADNSSVSTMQLATSPSAATPSKYAAGV